MLAAAYETAVDLRARREAIRLRAAVAAERARRCPKCTDGVQPNGEQCWDCGASGVRS